MHYIALHYTILCTTLHCATLHYTALYNTTQLREEERRGEERRGEERREEERRGEERGERREERGERREERGELGMTLLSVLLFENKILGRHKNLFLRFHRTRSTMRRPELSAAYLAVLRAHFQSAFTRTRQAMNKEKLRMSLSLLAITLPMTWALSRFHWCRGRYTVTSKVR